MTAKVVELGTAGDMSIAWFVLELFSYLNDLGEYQIKRICTSMGMAGMKLVEHTANKSEWAIIILLACEM